MIIVIKIYILFFDYEKFYLKNYAKLYLIWFKLYSFNNNFNK